jgi:predicted acyltransferase
MKPTQRLLALDVMRGITIAGMIMVNNPGSWSYVYTPLGHASWNGLTPTDLVFPFFMFIMGISMFLSYQKFDFRLTGKTFLKLLRRSALLFLVGLALGWLSLSWRQWNALDTTQHNLTGVWLSVSSLENLRIPGVLQRLALVSLFGTLIALSLHRKLIPRIIAGILLAYWILIHVTDSYAMSPDSIVAIIDRLLLGETHMYRDTMTDGTRIAFDPEGLVSTLPGIAHVLTGFWAGQLLSVEKKTAEKLQGLLLFGTVLLFAGLLLHYGFPINKKIWSPSFVLTTCGMGSLLLGLLVYIIDIRGKKRWSVFFESFGVNPMFVYVLGAVLSIVAGNLLIDRQGTVLSLKTILYTNIFQPLLGNYPGSLAFAICFVVVCWLAGHYLYKKKIYIKL